MKLKNVINKHKSNKIKENSNTVRHLNNGTDHRHSKSCCDQSSPASRTIIISHTWYIPLSELQRTRMCLKQGRFWSFKTILGTRRIHYQHMTSLAFYYPCEEYWDLHRLYVSFYQIVKCNSLYLSSPSTLYNFSWVSMRSHGLYLTETKLRVCYISIYSSMY